ncbi:hypothetical protein GcC1_210014 [Golovinomyces cichoracearum]|uniref:MICOS complex subunit MIC12 n=1 Tax=Golovinomyces cichoracearum TaxID=62708 RepID=A0A420HAY2_9PEZI|nr:hypothetical protein GcC1_210014 [Golovinomyces cichoracearum]
MGFRRGFAGGITLTIGILYLTVKSPKYDRQAQAVTVYSQSHLRNSLCQLKTRKSQGSTLNLSRDYVSKSFVENFKSQWNEEIANLAWWINQKDWNKMRYEAGKVIYKIVRRSDEESEANQSLESNSLSKMNEAVDRGKAAIKNTMATMKDGAKAKVEDSIRAAENFTTDTYEATLNSIDNVLDREKGLTSSTVEKTSSKLVSLSLSQPGTIEETLQKRYAGLASKKSVEETLEDRYKPIDKNDSNT